MATDTDFRTLRRTVESSPLYRLLGIELARVEPGIVEATLVADERHVNVDGVVQGGIYGLLADTAMGFAARTMRDAADLNKTLGMSVDFLDGAATGERMVADARCVHASGRFAWTEASILAVGEGGTRTIGRARSLNLAVSRPR